MTSTEQARHPQEQHVADELHAAARTVVVRPSGHLWTGALARVPAQRRRRTALRAVPAVVLVMASVAIVLGVLSIDRGGRMTVVPGDAPTATPSAATPSAGGSARSASPVRPITFDAAEQVALQRHCYDRPFTEEELRAGYPAMRIAAAVLDTDTDVATVVYTGSTSNGLGGAKTTFGGLCAFQRAVPSNGERSQVINGGSFAVTPTPRRPLEVLMFEASDMAGIPGTPRRLGYYETAGQVGAGVARVTATTADGRVLDVPIQHGYFVVGMSRDESDAPVARHGGQGSIGQVDGALDDPAFLTGMDAGQRAYWHWRERTRTVIRAYDRDGHLIGTAKGA